jgi:hypothetical protein
MTGIGAILMFMATSAAVPVGDVHAVTIAGEPISGMWSGSDGENIILLQEGAPRRFALPELSVIRWPETETAAPAANPDPDRVVVHLADGGRLAARIRSGDGKRIQLDSALAGTLDVPMSGLAGIRLQPDADNPETKEAFDAALARRDPAQDVLFSLRDGRLTTVRGVTELLNAEGGSFRWRNRAVPIQRESVYGIVFASGVGGRQPAQALCVVRDGTMLGGRITGGDAGHVELELTVGGSVRLPVTELVEIRLRSDRVLFLSDLEPTEYVFEPFSITHWPYRRDRSVTNQPLRIGGQTYERGIGMHSQAVLVYTLPDSFASFAAVIGIDDVPRPLGNAVFRVLADGQEVFNSGPVTGRDEARPILVPIGGSRKLELAVDFGEDLDIGDHANWANARVLK